MAQYKKTPSKRRTNNAGAELMEGVRQMHDAIATGDHTRFKTHKVEVPDPSQYEPHDIRALRCSLQITQALFARMIGVSKELVEHWEQGIRHPSPLARRFMDRIKDDPSLFVMWLMRNYPRPGTRAKRGATDNATKTQTRAFMKLAARVFSRREMLEVVQAAYRSPAGR